ncbi:uncharacterized protein G2W53_028566 [Senna tora]|uniref:Uncharacterized protein n=1 Tax=Senna tora TaxID=362788 RepID=A0A834W9U6_9FABA|nr:uncharacterized protein G2W53_028566 [Senna tora]
MGGGEAARTGLGHNAKILVKIGFNSLSTGHHVARSAPTSSGRRGCTQTRETRPDHFRAASGQKKRPRDIAVRDRPGSSPRVGPGTGSGYATRVLPRPDPRPQLSHSHSLLFSLPSHPDAVNPSRRHLATRARRLSHGARRLSSAARDTLRLRLASLLFFMFGLASYAYASIC